MSSLVAYIHRLWCRVRGRSFAVRPGGRCYGYITPPRVPSRRYMGVFHRHGSGRRRHGLIVAGPHPPLSLPGAWREYDDREPLAVVRAKQTRRKGVWVAGSLVAGASFDFVSGDWRLVDGRGLVLVGIIGVHDAGLSRVRLDSLRPSVDQ